MAEREYYDDGTGGGTMGDLVDPRPPRRGRRYARGYGDPAAGYGPGGVESPAYRGARGEVTDPSVGARPTRGGGYRTADMRDANQNGIDDRDEGGADYRGHGGWRAAQDRTKPTATAAEPADQAWRDSLRSDAFGKAAKSQMHGFREDDYGGDTKARTSVKNTFQAIARDYDATPEGLRALVQDPRFKRAFPNASLVPHPTGDKIDFGGVLSDFESGSPVGIIDVGLSFDGANNTGAGWWWGNDADGTGPTTYQPMRTAADGQPVNTTMPVGRSPYMDQFAYEELARQGRYGYPAMDDLLPPLVR